MFVCVFGKESANCKLILETVQQLHAELSEGFATWWHQVACSVKYIWELRGTFLTCTKCSVEYTLWELRGTFLTCTKCSVEYTLWELRGTFLTCMKCSAEYMWELMGTFLTCTKCCVVYLWELMGTFLMCTKCSVEYMWELTACWMKVEQWICLPLVEVLWKWFIEVWVCAIL